MIGKVTRGDRVAGLLHYLYGPGRSNEHTNQHLAAAWDSPTRLEPALQPDGRYDLRHLADLLGQPLAASGATSSGISSGTSSSNGSVADKPVWHCSLRTAPEDPVLDDAEWDRIARDVLHRTGLAPHDDPGGCRWVAVRHAEDHVHLVVTLARQDGAPLRLFRDYYRVGEACRAQEERLGLRRTAARDRTAAPAPTRAETEKAARASTVPARVQLRQEAQLAAASADSPEEFLSTLRARGVLVRERFSEQHPGQVTGYALALADDRAADGEPVWFGGSKLAPELSWGRLQQHWLDDDRQQHDRPVSERSGNLRSSLAGSHRALAAASAPTSAPGAVGTITTAANRLSEAAAHVAFRTSSGVSRTAAEAIAVAGCDVLAVTAHLFEGPGTGPLCEAADLARRAARPAHGRRPPGLSVATGLRRAARDLARLPPSEARGAEASRATVQLLRATADLIDAIMQLRLAQERVGQVEAASRAIALVSEAADVRAPLAARTPPPLSIRRTARSAHTTTPKLRQGWVMTPPHPASAQSHSPRR